MTIEYCSQGNLEPSYVKNTPGHDQLFFVMMELVMELMFDFMLEWNNLNTFQEDLFNL